MFQAVLTNGQHPEHGVVTVPYAALDLQNPSNGAQQKPRNFLRLCCKI